MKEESILNNKIKVTLQDVINIARFSGLTIKDIDPDLDLDSVFVVEADTKITNDSKSYYTNKLFYCNEHPEYSVLPILCEE